MIRSMTGFGRREGAVSGGTLVVEVRSVNHRYSEIVLRLPKSISRLEEDLKKLVQQRCRRGRVDVSVLLTGGREGEKTLQLDRSLARQYHRLLLRLQRDLRLKGAVDVGLLAGFRDILSVSEQPAEDPRVKRTVVRLLKGALSDHETMRGREGAALARDIQAHVRALRQAAAAVSSRAPILIQAHFEKMQKRVEKLLGGALPDANRLNQELAVYADRSDISEELARLDSHLTQFEGGLKSREPVGKTLDFLLQEMGREVNTIGSKANDADLAMHVVRMKGELEKIREQVQNVE